MDGIGVGPATHVVVDGVLDEPAWAEAVPATSFVRYRPSPGGSAVGTTEVRFLQDDRYLYVGMRVDGADYDVRARISPREDINSDDQIGVYLDTWHDGRSGYVFYLNPLGIQQDARVNGSSWTVDWDTVLRSRGRVDADGRGYSIELAIPWRSLKYPSGEGPQTWGVILTRKIPSEGYKYSYPPIQDGHPALFAQAAALHGVTPPRRGAGLELLPSVAVGRAWSAPEDLGAWDGPPWTALVRPSVDLRYGLTPDLGLAATANPDFSQVEADVADVRLNARFAFQFPERRPFFLDGVDAYADRRATLYTRSVADPAGGLKITGREGGTSIGVVSAVDRQPLGSFHEHGSPGMSPEPGAAWASDTFARIRFDALASGQIGLVVADKRLFPAPGAPASAAAGPLDGTYTGFGADATLPLGGRWVVGGSAQQSAVATGGAGLYGQAFEASLQRTSGLGTGLGLYTDWTSADFRQELGFLNYSGYGSGSAFLDHTFTRYLGGFDTVTPSISVSDTEETDGEFTRIASTNLDVVKGATWGWVGGSVGDRGFRDVRQATSTASAGGGGQVGRTLEFSLYGNAGRSLDYRVLRPATDANGGLSASVRPSVSTRIDVDLSQAFHQPQGHALERSAFLRSRFTWQFTRVVGTRVILQRDRVVEELGTTEGLLLSGLLTFLTVPGTAVYVGWNERLDLLGGGTLERSVFAKASVRLRP